MRAPPTLPPSVFYVDASRVALSIAFIACVVWIVDYSRTGWWRNHVGQNLVTKTALLTAIIGLTLVASILRLSPFWTKVIRWATLGLITMIGPVMFWRMWVFHRVGAAVVQCPAGHHVSVAFRFCPTCGLAILPPPPAD